MFPQCVDTSWTLCGGPSLYLCCDAGTTCYSTTVDGKSEVGCLAAGGSLGVGEISVGLVLPSSTSKTSVTAAPSTTQTSRLASSNTVRTTTTGACIDCLPNSLLSYSKLIANYTLR